MTRPDWTQFAPFVDENGRVDPVLPLRPVYRPKQVWSRFKRGFFWCGWGLHSAKDSQRAAVPELLRFIRLADGTDQQIADFARLHGVLRLCKHGVPFTHVGVKIAGAEPMGTPCNLVRHRGRYFERFQWWRRLAAEARAIFRISINHHEQQTGLAEDWETLRGAPAQPMMRTFLPLRATTLERERRWLLDYVGVWILMSGVRPHAFWGASGKMNVGLTGGLAGTLAVQLLSAVTGTPGSAACASCGTFFTIKHKGPGRKPRYCSNCGRRESMRIASKRHRDKIRGMLDPLRQHRGSVAAADS